MIDYMFWIGVVLWSIIIVMCLFDNKVSCSELFILSMFIFSGGVVIILFFMSFLYGVLSVIELVAWNELFMANLLLSQS